MLMKSAITLITTALLCTTSLFAQLSYNNEVKPSDSQDEIQLLIVRNAEECLAYESSIYELINGQRHKVAFLYHEVDQKNAASNFYNLNTIREVLNAYSNKGYQIKSSNAQNMDGKCNRSLQYTLARTPNYTAEN